MMAMVVTAMVGVIRRALLLQCCASRCLLEVTEASTLRRRGPPSMQRAG